MSTRWKITFCAEPHRAGELAEFFTKNVTTQYISHSELQGPRALSPNKWQPNLSRILEDEIGPRLQATAEGRIGRVSQPILTVEDDNTLLAVAFVTFAGDAAIPYAVLEDMVVEEKRRGQGIGHSIIEFVGIEARSRGIERLFLESGKTNEHAHHLFESTGFELCSIVMMKKLSGSSENNSNDSSNSIDAA